jgi:apolipoprotein N-acyltransferase
LFQFIWLFIGGFFRLFDFGKKTIPIAAWLSPIFLLHFAHGLDPLSGLFLIWFTISIAAYFAYRDVIPVPGIAYPLIVALLSLTWTLPYLADRLLYARYQSSISTLIFPSAWVVMEFLTAYTSPFGTWGSVAYTQYGNRPLMQLASATGLWGISFLITWFGSIINWAWEHQFDWMVIRTGVLVFALTLVIVMLAGGVRLAFAKSKRTVRVATIGWPKNILERDAFIRLFTSKALTESEQESFRKSFIDLQDYFLEESRREAQAGAKIIVWPEANLGVFKADEPMFMQRAEQLAREQIIYILMGMGTVVEGNPSRLENKAVLVDPVNGVVYSYLKKNPVPGWEAQISVKSDGQIHPHDSEYGRLGSAICFDMDFPHFIRRFGKSGTDILLVPASDWESIKYLHNVMAVFRAVENGTSLIRATRWGMSAGIDAFGRTLAITDSFSATQDVTVAQVPVKGVSTLYARMGNWFAWACVIGLLGFVIWGIQHTI